MDKEKALKEFGLSDKESLVYLELLKLGKINLQELAKKIDLPRTTIYNTLNYLYVKGLISKIVKGNTTDFEAADPSKLMDTINQKKEILLSILPELEGLKKQLSESSNVEIYEGFKGVSTILLDIFKKKQQTYYFGSYSKSVEVLKHLPEHFRTLRLDNPTGGISTTSRLVNPPNSVTISSGPSRYRQLRTGSSSSSSP